jgi:hypothetical protein
MRKILKIGMIGYNDGNGHPYSYSAIFNGYNKKKLLKKCPYPIIKDYLIKQHKNKDHSPHAKLTHIWTQNKKISKNIAAISKIPNIVNSYKSLASKVDCVILARDDVKNHFHIASFFLQKKIPIFIDKQLILNKSELLKIKKIIKKNNSLFVSGSTARYSNELKKIKKFITIDKLLSIHSISKGNWMRYAHHVLEPITIMIGSNIKYIRALNSTKKNQILQIKYNNNINVVLEFSANHCGIKSTFYLKNQKPVELCIKDYFSSFKRTLMKFIEMVRLNKKMIPYKEIFNIANIVIKGQESLDKNGKKINF